MLWLARMALDLTTIAPRPPNQLDDCALLALTLNQTFVSAATLLARFGGLHGLMRTPFAELARARVTPRSALQLHAAVELGRRSLVEPLKRGHPLTTPSAVVDAMTARLAALEQEQLLVVGFDSQQRVVVDFVAAMGSGSGVGCVPADVLRTLVLHAAQAFAIIHNHPSGVPRPSDLDRDLTRRLRDAGRLVGVELVDHIIVGREGAFSFAGERTWRS
jgi:DNA repair protein RadC